VDPYKTAFHGGLEVSGEAPVAAEPTKGAFNDPPPIPWISRMDLPISACSAAKLAR